MNSAEIASWISDAQKAFSAASDLDQLKVARLAHTGDKAPISLASRSLGSLSPEDIEKQRECFHRNSKLVGLH